MKNVLKDDHGFWMVPRRLIGNQSICEGDVQGICGVLGFPTRVPDKFCNIPKSFPSHIDGALVLFKEKVQICHNSMRDNR